MAVYAFASRLYVLRYCFFDDLILIFSTVIINYSTKCWNAVAYIFIDFPSTPSLTRSEKLYLGYREEHCTTQEQPPHPNNHAILHNFIYRSASHKTSPCILGFLKTCTTIYGNGKRAYVPAKRKQSKLCDFRSFPKFYQGSSPELKHKSWREIKSMLEEKNNPLLPALVNLDSSVVRFRNKRQKLPGTLILTHTLVEL